MMDTDKLREKYKQYWGEGTDDSESFDEFGDLIDVDLANEIVEWSTQAADKIDTQRNALETCKKIVTGEIKHINQQARLLHILEIIEEALSK